MNFCMFLFYSLCPNKEFIFLFWVSQIKSTISKTDVPNLTIAKYVLFLTIDHVDSSGSLNIQKDS